MRDDTGIRSDQPRAAQYSIGDAACPGLCIRITPYDAKLSTHRTGHKSRVTLQRIGRVYGWNDRPVVSITDDDAAAMLHDIANRRGKRTMANQTKCLSEEFLNHMNHM